MRTNNFIKSKLYILIVIVCFLILFWKYKSLNSQLDLLIKISNPSCYKYKQECINLFKKLRYPNQSLIIRPPLKMPPKDLINEFTQNGDMPITKEWYINEVYSDSTSLNTSNIQEIIKIKDFSIWLDKVKKHEPLNYGNTKLQTIMNKYLNRIQNKSILIMGTQIPWIEAISYELLASKITTLDYTRKQYESSNRLEWFHVNDYLDDLILKNIIEIFDNSASFSSIEHSGLGRYGDPLSPNGDIEAVQQIHCLLKPNGLFFLGLPSSKSDKSYIEFNAHRVYGSKRLDKLFVGWNLIDKLNSHDFHSIFVLEKNSKC
jgi:hypothetical protein